MDEQDLFEVDNNFGDYIDEIDFPDCPFVDDKLLEFIKFRFNKEISFDKDVKYEEYMYKTGIVEVVKFLHQKNKQQKEK